MTWKNDTGIIGFGFGAGSIPGAGTANASHYYYVSMHAFSPEAELIIIIIIITHVPNDSLAPASVHPGRRANNAWHDPTKSGRNS
jgi:hypothetical protein